MLDEFGLAFPALQKLAIIVRGADTARPDLAPEGYSPPVATAASCRPISDPL